MEQPATTETVSTDGGKDFLRRKSAICSKKRFWLAFSVTLTFACLAYSYLSLYVEDDYDEHLRWIPERLKTWLKLKTTTWKTSLPGDMPTCEKMVELLTQSAPSNNNIVLDFIWPTPNFACCLTGHNSSCAAVKRKLVVRKLCSRYDNATNFNPTRVLTSETWLSNAEASYYVTRSKLASIGDVIRIFIVTRNSKYRNLSKSVGGDFFKVRLDNPYTLSSVVASNVRHLGNGAYVADVRLQWSGRHFVNVFFGQSAHVVDVLKRLTSGHGQFATSFHALFSERECNGGISNLFCDEGTKEKTRCFEEPPKACYKPLCNFTNKNGENWYCEAPSPPLTCDDWFSLYTQRKTNALQLFEIFPKDDRGTTVRTAINGKVRRIEVGADGKRTGYWYYGVWKSNVCANGQFFTNPKRLFQCLQGRTIYFLGDSTVRQLYEFFVYGNKDQAWGNLRVRETKRFNDVWDPRRALMDRTLTTLHYRCHGPPLQNGGKISSMRYISNELDAIPRLDMNGKLLTVIIGIGQHFLLYNPTMYLKRIKIIKQAALRLLKRNPQATVIFKGTGTFLRGSGTCHYCLSDWLSYRLSRLAARLFANSSVVYMDVWDMTLSHVTEELIHPVNNIVRNQLELALSFACPNLVVEDV